jgi:hypothetical protein
MAQRRCSYCYQRGHNRRTCPSLKQYVADNPDSYTARTESRRKASHSDRKCSYCNDTGHNRRTCPTLEKHKRSAVLRNREFRATLLESMREHGFGEGALIEVDGEIACGWVRNDDGELTRSYRVPDYKMIGIVTRINWENACYRVNHGAEGGFYRVAWLNAYNRDGGQLTTNHGLEPDNLDRMMQRVKSGVDTDRFDASKPYGWERSATSDVAHIFVDSKAYYHSDLD